MYLWGRRFVHPRLVVRHRRRERLAWSVAAATMGIAAAALDVPSIYEASRPLSARLGIFQSLPQSSGIWAWVSVRLALSLS